MTPWREYRDDSLPWPAENHRRGLMAFTASGFTLAEMVLVISLMAMVGLCVYGTVINGLKIWQRATKLSYEEDLAIALDKFDADLRNTFSFSKFTFEGEPEKIAFPTIIRTRADKKGASRHEGYVDQIGIVQYGLDPLKSGLVYKQANYGDALKGDFTNERLLLTQIYAMKFTYYVHTDNQVLKKVRWDEGIPSAVEVEIRILEQGGDIRTVQRMINIPVAQQGTTDEVSPITN